MAKVRIYQKPAGIPVNTSVFAVEILQNNIWYTRKVSWETLKGLIAGAESLVFANGTLTFTTPDGIAHQVLSVDSEVTPNSANPVSGGAVSTALAGKQNVLTFDQVPTDGSTNPVESNGIYDALALKQDVLTFDTTPTDGSTNPVTSQGIYAAISAVTSGIDWKEAVATYADIATTYPNPQDGWTVTTLDDDHTYRYTGTEWVDMFSLITLATAEKDGLMSAADFTKLAGIEAEATKTVVSDTLTPSTTTKKLATVSSGGSSTDILGDDADAILRAAFGEHTVTGNPVTFDAFLGLEVASECKVTMLPIQDLSHGDPSPTNICPISGRDSVTVTRTGKNHFDKTAKDTSKGYVANRYLTDTGGQIQPGSGSWYISEYMECEENTGYTLTGLSTTESNAPCLGFYNSNKIFISSLQYRNEGTKAFTTPSNATYIRISVGPNATKEDNITLLETGKIQTYTHTYSSTVYGGVDDFVSGEGLSNYKTIDLGTRSWTYDSQYGRFVSATTVSDMKLKDARKMKLWCSHFKEISDGRPITQVPNNAIYTGSRYIDIHTDLYGTDPEAFKTAMSGVQFCYEIQTPVTLTNTPEDITLLKGVNVLSTDGDSLELKYSADIKAYIDSKLNA